MVSHLIEIKETFTIPNFSGDNMVYRKRYKYQNLVQLKRIVMISNDKPDRNMRLTHTQKYYSLI